MTFTASEYARSVPNRRAFDWAELEVGAFSQQPEIQHAISPKHGRANGRPGGPAGSSHVVTWVAGLLLVLPQIEAYLRLTAGSRLGTSVYPTEAVHNTGTLSAVSAAVLVVLSVMAYRRRRSHEAASPGLGGVLLAGVLACGVNLLLLVLKGARNDVTDWPLWSLPSLLCIVLGIVLFTTDSSPAARIRTLVGQLSPAEADVVRRQIDEALDILHSRRILRDDELERAKGVRLGLLNLSMFPLEQKASADR